MLISGMHEHLLARSTAALVLECHISKLVSQNCDPGFYLGQIQLGL